MDHKYRTRTVSIEAFQMTCERRTDNRDWPEWLNVAWNASRSSLGAVFPTLPGSSSGTVSICTLEGEHLVNFDDWLIHGVQTPCNPAIFAATYEPSEEP